VTTDGALQHAGAVTETMIVMMAAMKEIVRRL